MSPSLKTSQNAFFKVPSAILIIKNIVGYEFEALSKTASAVFEASTPDSNLMLVILEY